MATRPGANLDRGVAPLALLAMRKRHAERAMPINE
jgi:hypothetical protein